MKNYFLYIVIALFAVFTSCDKDGEKLVVSGMQEPTLVSAGEEVILTPSKRKAPMIALNWTDSELTLSNTAYGITGEFPYVRIELSATEDFASYQSVEPDSHTYAFSGGDLNTICRNLGFEAEKSQELYIRVNTSYGTNTEALYGNTLSFEVTTYEVDLYHATILDEEHADTGFKFYSPDADGVYYGFAGVPGWYKWYLQDGDYTLWGNDGVAETPFLLSSDETTQYNMWYPGQTGCYYTTLNTNTKEWTATYIPTLNVSGSSTGQMTFNQNEVSWLYSLTTTEDNATIKISTNTAALYNMASGDKSAGNEAVEMSFSPASDGGIIVENTAASAGEFTFGVAGDYTLTIYLSDFEHLTYEITDGLTDGGEPLSERLYLPGIDDLISGSWTFDNYLHLLSETDSTFAGVVNADSEWGYTMSLKVDEWNDVYKLGDTEGTLAFKGENNIPAPDKGLNLIHANLSELTYSHTLVNTVSYAGFNDNWDFVNMDATSVPGVFTSSVTFTTVYEWGGKIYLNQNWTTLFGGFEGTLYYGGSGITDDASIDLGTYDLVLDVIKQTYAFIGDEVYVTGLNDDWTFGAVTLTKTSTGVYSGSVTITQLASNGIQIQLDDSWSRYYGGSLGNLSYKGGNIDVSSLTNGDYDITIDFINNTCSFQSK